MTVFAYGWPTFVGAAVGTTNCHCRASISVSTSGDGRVVAVAEKK
jgi:hypothetical protein